MPIRKLGDPVLGRPVRTVEAVTPDLVRVSDDMIETMRAARGVGLAANQVGLDLAIAVVQFRDTLLRMFNPKILCREGRQRVMEGCLSVPGIEGDVTRPLRVEVRWLDRDGGPMERAFQGHLARIVEHEVDHLEGVLFLNHLSVAVRALQRKAIEQIRHETLERMRTGT